MLFNALHNSCTTLESTGVVGAVDAEVDTAAVVLVDIIVSAVDPFGGLML